MRRKSAGLLLALCHGAGTRTLFLVVTLGVVVNEVLSRPPERPLEVASLGHAPQHGLSLTVVDENGRPIAAARATLEHAEAGARHARETDAAGRCVFSDLPPGLYRLRVERERFYPLTVRDVRLPENDRLEVVLLRQQEFIEVVEVKPSSPALDPWETTGRVTMGTREVLTLPTSVPRDLRYALAQLPGVVQDAHGNLHIAGSASARTLTLLDGFNITPPLSGIPAARVSVDAVREVTIHSSRYSAEYGKGSGGVLDLNTHMGEDRFRFSATDFLPSLQSRKGVHVNNWTPRATVSGPIQKKRAWFYDAFESEYDLTIVEELPLGADRNRIWRVGNLARAQVNMTPSHLLTFSALLNRFRSPHDGLSRFAPLLTTRRVSHGADALSARGQIYRPDGLILEYGVGIAHFRSVESPWGEEPYILSPEGTSGSFFKHTHARARRVHALFNLTLPQRVARGRHEIRLGADLTHLSVNLTERRRPILILRRDGTRVRESRFVTAPGVRETTVELAFYGQDRWSFSSRGLLEFGVRGDWDDVLRRWRWSPRLAMTSLLTADRRTKLVGGIGLFRDATDVELLLRSRLGERQDIFYAPDGQTPRGDPWTITFQADARRLAPPRALIGSIALERQIASGLFLSLELLRRRERRGWIYVPSGEVVPSASSSSRFLSFHLHDRRRDRYDALHLTMRWSIREAYPVFASYVRSSARSNAVLDFTLDTMLIGPQVGGPLPWDTPHRFLLWGWLPLPRRFELAYTTEWRVGYPFSVVNEEQRLIEPPNRRRLPPVFSVNLHVERRFRLFGLQWAVRIGLNNVTNHPNPSTVNNNVDSPHFLTWGGRERRTLLGRIRLLGRK